MGRAHNQGLLHVRAGPRRLLQGAGGSPTGDPYWSNVVFLAGYEIDGPANQLAITDESSKANHLTRAFGSATSGAPGRFGAYCAYQPNSDGGFWYRENDADFLFGSGAFTIETWVQFSTAPTSSVHYLIAQYDTGANQRSWALLVNGGNLQLLTSTNGTSSTSQASAAWAPSTGVWYHVAADYDGTAVRTYVNGVLHAKTAVTQTLHNSTGRFSLSAATSSGSRNGAFKGFLDETRITKGVARYASDSGFAAPTAAYPRG